MILNFSLGVYGGIPIHEAIERAISVSAAGRLIDPVLGKISTKTLQICPQNRGPLDAEKARWIQTHYPETSFLLHANIHVESLRSIFDLAQFSPKDSRWCKLREVNHALRGKHYSAHAGKREHADMDSLILKILDAQDFFGVPVAVEGHYPERHRMFLLSSWDDYRRILANHEVHFVIDLAHINILVRHERLDEALLKDLLSCERCLEVHLSDNDGRKDNHTELSTNQVPWWVHYLPFIHDGATIFYEGRPPLQ